MAPLAARMDGDILSAAAACHPVALEPYRMARHGGQWNGGAFRSRSSQRVGGAPTELAASNLRLLRAAWSRQLSAAPPNDLPLIRRVSSLLGRLNLAAGPDERDRIPTVNRDGEVNRRGHCARGAGEGTSGNSVHASRQTVAVTSPWNSPGYRIRTLTTVPAGPLPIALRAVTRKLYMPGVRRLNFTDLVFARRFLV